MPDLFKAKRRISERQAERCENAEGPICRCRCSGAFHGGKRGDVWLLPLGDPHSVKKSCPVCLGTGVIQAWNKKFMCGKCNGVGYTEPKKKIKI